MHAIRKNLVIMDLCINSKGVARINSYAKTRSMIRKEKERGDAHIAIAREVIVKVELEGVRIVFKMFRDYLVVMCAERWK